MDSINIHGRTPDTTQHSGERDLRRYFVKELIDEAELPRQFKKETRWDGLQSDLAFRVDAGCDIIDGRSLSIRGNTILNLISQPRRAEIGLCWVSQAF